MSAPNVKVVFKACLLCCTKGALLNHRCTRSPFPAGECKRMHCANLITTANIVQIYNSA